MLKLIDRLLDRLPGSGVYYITAAATGLTAAANSLAEALPGNEPVTTVLLWVASWLGAFAGIYRRGTEVPAESRGFRS